jgi:hypothetical protein
MSCFYGLHPINIIWRVLRRRSSSPIASTGPFRTGEQMFAVVLSAIYSDEFALAMGSEKRKKPSDVVAASESCGMGRTDQRSMRGKKILYSSFFNYFFIFFFFFYT